MYHTTPISLVLLVWLTVVGSGNNLNAQDEKPFPENRVRNFYADQARQFIESGNALPKILPQFPGLDGGNWGHWGQNPESENADPRLNEVDTGGLLMQVTRHFGHTTHKGVNVRVGDYTSLFDPEKLSFVDAWQGDLVKWSSGRYGITSGVDVKEGRMIGPQASRWDMPEGTVTRYLGFSRFPGGAEFEYTIGGVKIADRIAVRDGAMRRIVRTSGDLPEGIRLSTSENLIMNPPEVPSPALKAMWADQTVTTKGVAVNGKGTYVIDTLTVPYRDANPFKTPMRIGGVDVLPDGRIAVCTLMGDVWIISGVDGALKTLTWRRFASGLNQPLGLVVADGDIHVIGRDQLTRLHDRNGDGEADYYECVTNDFPTEAGNNFALTLHHDTGGRFYWFTRSAQFGMTRYTPGSAPEAIATGLRGTNGTGVSPDGSIVFAQPQEGSWQPASAIFEVGNGSYHGFFGPKPEFGKHGYQMPLCFIPRGIDNSSGDIVFVPEDPRFGPLAGKMIGTSFGYCQHYMVLREETASGVQGGVVPLPGEFLSGAHRLRFSNADGCLYVVGSDGWQSYAKEDGSLQRVRYTGGTMHLPESIETRSNGLLIRFNTPIDPSSANANRAFCQQWNYLHSSAYGSPEYSVKHPGLQGHDPVEIRSVQHLIGDSKTIFVEIPQLHPVMQLHLHMELKTSTGEAFSPDIYYSIFQLGEPFELDGLREIPKQPWNDFPSAAESKVDPRLIAQENMGKIVGDEPMLAAIAKLRVDTVAGLQFEPKNLTVKAGARVALTVTNKDPSMPHNLVLVRPESLSTVGEGSMQLASLPEGVAKHYVIDDPGVLAMSPILESGTSYIIYFDAPKTPGSYPFLCTYPGHWRVTQGVLQVIAE
ncbi:MAG: azurin [Verrucomicrobiales bacterium]|jgi:azurin